ncbi:TonB family protein [bacterium]|nr:TonB family protein [bacterium]
MITWIHHTADIWSEYALWIIVQNTIFLLLIFGILRFIKTCTANLKYWIGILALVKCVLPPFLPATFLRETVESAGTARIHAFPIVTAVSDESSVILFSVSKLLFIGWVFLSIIILIIPAVNTLHLHFRLRHALPLGLTNDSVSVPVYTTDKILVPMNLGFFKPRIYMPEQWTQWSFDCRTMILRHEMAHVHRKDTWFRLLQMIVQALYAFHPLIWILNRKIEEYREMACDDVSVGPYRTCSVEYARVLVRIAEDLKHVQLGYVSASALIRQRNELLNRVQYQLEGSMKKLSRLKTALIIGLILACSVPLSWTKSRNEIKPTSNTEILTGATIKGIVKGKDGNFLKNATVRLKDTSISATTNASGAFEMNHIPKGKYQLQILTQDKLLYNYSFKVMNITDTYTLQFKLGDNEFTNATGIFGPKQKAGKISGNITDTETGLPLVGANVVLEGTDRGAATDENGNYFIPNVEPGKYNLKLSMMGYGSICIKDVEVTQGTSLKTPMQLKPQVIAFNTLKAPLETEAENALRMVPTDSDEKITFVAYDTPPFPLGGFEGIQKNLVYPEIARKAGIEGRVTVQAKIDVDGTVIQTKVVQSLGSNGCDESAINAVKAVQWKPAMQRGNPVAVWIAVPIEFSLE